MHRILIIEDDIAVSNFLFEHLRAEYHVVRALTLKDADTELARDTFDLILLDGTLPDGDGYRYCSKLRSQEGFREIPIIFLTGHAELQDKIMGFSLGADDYLVKPFQMEELRARLAAHLKRSGARNERSATLNAGDLVLDTRYHKASIVIGTTTENLVLTSLEFKLLYHLASRAGEVCSRESLISDIWGKNIHVSERTIDSHLSNLRKKLGSSGWTVQSVHGVGYHWVPKGAAAKAA